jgi:phage gp16-like protein
MSVAIPITSRTRITIQIAKKELDVADEVYRGLLQNYGVATSSKLSEQQGQHLVAHFKSKGWVPRPSKGSGKQRPKRPTPAPENAALVSRIRAQLISLGRLPDTYADGIAKQAFKVDFFEWCTPDQLHDLTNMLRAEQNRQGARKK